MTDIKFCLAQIVRNEENVISDSINSVKQYLDLAIIDDTGSSDNTLKIARELLGDSLITYSTKWKKFGENRTINLNHAFDFISEIIKKDNELWYIILLDADDIVKFGEYGIDSTDILTIKSLKPDIITSQFINGNFITEKPFMVKYDPKNKYKFIGLVEEKLIPSNDNCVVMKMNDWKITDRRLGFRARNKQALKEELLLLQLDDINSDNNFHLGLKYENNEMWNKALSYYNDYLSSEIVNSEMAYLSKYGIANCLNKLGRNDNDIFFHLFTGIGLNPFRFECPRLLLDVLIDRKMFMCAFLVSKMMLGNKFTYNGLLYRFNKLEKAKFLRNVVKIYKILGIEFDNKINKLLDEFDDNIKELILSEKSQDKKYVPVFSPNYKTLIQFIRKFSMGKFNDLIYYSLLAHELDPRRLEPIYNLLYVFRNLSLYNLGFLIYNHISFPTAMIDNADDKDVHAWKFCDELIICMSKLKLNDEALEISKVLDLNPNVVNIDLKSKDRIVENVKTLIVNAENKKPE